MSVLSKNMFSQLP